MTEQGSRAAGFSWEALGDIADGRPNLGRQAPVAVYRLLQYTLRQAITDAHGEVEARRLLVAAGRIAGREFCRHLLDRSLAPGPFLAELQRRLREWGIGILRLERADFERGEFVLSVAEDLDCSGLPVSDETVCDFDEGFIAGIFREYAGRDFTAREVDCWASGERVCRFEVRPAGDGDAGA
jgi:predicted hydrocarbon binding protein